MGAQLSSQSAQAASLAEYVSSYMHVDMADKLDFEASLRSTRFLKTSRAKWKDVSSKAVVKVFVKPHVGLQLGQYSSRITDVRNRLSDVLNVLPFRMTFENDRAGFLLRDYVIHNLYDRISTRPFLNAVEKRWIAYQLLRALQGSHAVGVCHGDIKSENVLVTSWTWVLLCDFASYKPNFLPEDNPAAFSFFFDTSGRRSCYIAPERFYDPAVESSPSALNPVFEHMDGELKPAMDVFSMGCVIAELLLEGKPLFDLSQLLAYRKGEFDPLVTLERIDDVAMRDLISRMIDISPESRLTAEQCLQHFDGVAFPKPFPFLHKYVSYVAPTGKGVTTLADARIEMIAASFSNLLEALGLPTSPDLCKQNTALSKETVNNKGVADWTSGSDALCDEATPLSLSQLDEIRIADALLSPSSASAAALSRFSFANKDYLKTANTVSDRKEADREALVTKAVTDEVEMGRGVASAHVLAPIALMEPPPVGSAEIDAEAGGMVVIASLVCSCARSVHGTAVKLRVLSLILATAHYVGDDIRLDRLLPFSMWFLSDPVPAVRAKAVYTLTRLLALVRDLPPSDANLFPEYVLRSLTGFPTDPSVSVRIMYARCIASLAEVALRFLEMSQRKINTVASSLHDDTCEEKLYPYQGSYDVELLALQEMVQEEVVKILTDPSPTVKRNLLVHMTRLCIFFGHDKANDVVLSHMITYLNDRSWHLRNDFFRTVVGVGTYVGSESLKQYVLPLLRQGLGDQEELVVATVLESLASLAELGLLGHTEARELAASITPLVCHPNVWIRHGAVAFLVCLGRSCCLADVHCILLPLVRPFLRCDLTNLEDEVALLDALLSPVPRVACDYVLGLSNAESFFAALVSRQQSLESSIVLPPVSVTARNTSAADAAIVNLQQLGMTEEDERKLLGLAAYLTRLSYRRQAHLNSSNDEDIDRLPSGKISLSSLGVELRNVELRASTRDTKTPVTPATVDAADGLPTAPISIPIAHTPTQGTNVSVGHDLDNLFGNTPSQEILKGRTNNVNRNPMFSSYGRGGDNLDPTADISGDLALLFKKKRADFFPSPLPDMGQLVASPTYILRREVSRENKRGRNTPVHHAQSLPTWRPEGVLVAHLHEHKAAVNCVEVTQDNLFFASASDDGTVKIWDCQRLEKNVTNRSRQTYSRQGGRIKAMTICEDSHSVASAADNGTIHVFRVEYSGGSNVGGGKGPAKYGGFAPLYIKTVNVEEEGCVVDMTHYNNQDASGHPSLLVYATVRGSVYGWDLRADRHAFRLVNPAHYGTIESFVVHPSRGWAMVGSRRGVYSCWDLRFNLPVKSWIHPLGSRIVKLALCPSIIAGDRPWILSSVGGNEISVWDVETAKCEQMYRTNLRDGQQTALPSMVAQDASRLQSWGLPLAELSRGAGGGGGRDAEDAASALGSSPVAARTILCPSNDAPFMLTTGAGDRRIRYWDMSGGASSYVVSGLSASTGTTVQQPSYSLSQTRDGISVCQEHPGCSNVTSVPAAAPGFSKQRGPTPPSVFHSDMITDLAVTELPELPGQQNHTQRVLISCSRSGEIKCWK